jgi:hypothetical protein
MAVALKLFEEFEGQSMTVLRVVAEAADDHPGGDPAVVESAARTRLLALLSGRLDEPAAPLPRQRAAS